MASTVEGIISQKESETNGRFKIKKAPRMLLPFAPERMYEKELNKQVSNLIRLTRENIYPILPRIEEEAELLRPKTDSIRLDDFSETIVKTIESTRIGFERLFTDKTKARLAQDTAFIVSNFNRKQITKVLRKMLGVDVFFGDPSLEAETGAFVESNVSLIKSIDQRYFNEVQEIVFRGARQGLRHEEIKKQIISRFSVTRNRAKLIARDQINKFNGQLTQLRQQSVGVKKYIWRTSLDERVRGNPVGRFPGAVPSHWDREGKEFSWDKPPSDGHPGEPVQCRCYAEPILEGLL